MNSLADVESGACGFRPYIVNNGIGLAAQWSHSLNMLDIDISSIYQEVCEMGIEATGECIGGLDVLVLCDPKQIFIGFLANLRNRTQYSVVDSVPAFHRKQGTAVSQIVIHGAVWEAIIRSHVQVLLHIDKNSTSCNFQFIEHWGQATCLKMATYAGLVLSLLLVILGILVTVGLVWGQALIAIMCRYILNPLYVHGFQFCMN